MTAMEAMTTNQPMASMESDVASSPQDYNIATERCHDQAKSVKGKLKTNSKICLEVVIILISFGFYIFDIFTDINLALEYYAKERWDYFGWTIGIVIIQALITSFFSVRLYMLDSKTYDISCRWLSMQILLTVLQIGPVVRNIQAFYIKLYSRNKDKKTWYNMFATWFQLLESILESAPQLILQLCILITEKPDFEQIFTMNKRSLSMLASWLSVSWSLVVYQHAFQRRWSAMKNMPIKAVPVYYLTRLLEVGPRVLVLAFFASYFDYWVILFISIRFAGMLMCNIAMRQPGDLFFLTLHSLIQVICYLDMPLNTNRIARYTEYTGLKKFFVRYRVLLYYTLFHVENAILLPVVYHATPDIGQWFPCLWLTIAMLGSPILHATTILFYYYCCLPTKDTNTRSHASDYPPLAEQHS